MLTGIETTSAFLHCCRTLTRLGSIANVCATLRSCAFAISYGFSRRCETGTSTVVTCRSFFLANRAFSAPAARSLLDRERDRPHRRRHLVRRVRDQPQRVRPGRKRLPG